MVVWNILWKRDFIGSERFDETLVCGEDAPFTLHLFAKEPRTYLETGFVSYAYRTAAGSSSRSLSLEKAKCTLRNQDERKRVVEESFPSLREELRICLMREKTKSLICLAIIGGKEAKALYKHHRMDYLSFGKMPKEQFGRKERILDLMIRMNVLWMAYRVKHR